MGTEEDYDRDGESEPMSVLLPLENPHNDSRMFFSVLCSFLSAASLDAVFAALCHIQVPHPNTCIIRTCFQRHWQETSTCKRDGEEKRMPLLER